MDSNYVWLTLAGTAGGVIMAILGLWDSGEHIDGRKFGASVLRAFVAGVVFAVSYELTGTLTIQDLFWAFLAGTGFDVAVNRIAGAMGWGSFPIPAKKEGS